MSMEMNNIITCPHCHGDKCHTETHSAEETSVTSYMCMDCGYTSTTLNIDGSNMLKSYEEVTPQLILDLKWVDPQTNLVWYPTVLNFPNTGLVFPDGTNTMDWGWTGAPAIDIPFDQQSRYPIPGQPGEYYKRRVDLESARKFGPSEFYQACQSIGLVKEV